MNKTLQKVGLVIGTIGFAFTLVASTTVSVTIPGAGVTNVLTGLGVSGPVVVKQAVLTGTSNSTVVAVYDSPTNVFNFVVAPYTNTISYMTNYVWSYNNYFGVATLVTNEVLYDNTNNLVPQSTNAYPQRIVLSASAGNSTTESSMNTYFGSGMWATNQNATNAGILTITFTQ